MNGETVFSGEVVFHTDSIPEPPMNFATVSPENEVEGIATEVEFIWNQTYDPDPLDEIHYQLVYATDWEDSSTYVFSELIQDTSITIELEDNAQYYWMVIALDTDDFIVGSNDNTPNTMVVGTLSIDGADIPEVFALHQNYPNPFTPTTQVAVVGTTEISELAFLALRDIGATNIDVYAINPVRQEFLGITVQDLNFLDPSKY